MTTTVVMAAAAEARRSGGAARELHPTIAVAFPYHARMSGDPPTAGPDEEPSEGSDDPFESLKDLEGFGDLGDLEDALSRDDRDDSRSGARSLFEGMEDLPLFGGLMQILQQGATADGGARGFARAVASGGELEQNIDPAERIAIEQLVRVAELRVTDATGLQPSRDASLRVEVVNRTGWADRTVSDYSDLFAALSSSLSKTAADPADEPEDPVSAMLAAVTKMAAPALLTVGTGAMVGQLAQSALGGYALPVPRPANKPMLVALPNVDSFGKQWSLDSDDLRMWVCLHEALYCAVFGVAHVREAVNEMLLRHASSFEINPDRFKELLGDFDPLQEGPEAFADLQSQLASPEAFLGATRSPAQNDLVAQLTALLAAVGGYVDHTMDRMGAELIGAHSRLSEALRRHRTEVAASHSFVERLLGLELDQAQYERGAAFAAGVAERAGSDELRRLFSDRNNLPTPAEVDAPGLWLARIDLPR
ncbi:MAG: zinc-dependent metalloprotease [Acidimicrobiaceae bacterium]|nr:zinc-dependent metalloprotease [Acidimicrobiaceae bacterium]